jgi:hypothetical protein
MLKLYMLTDTNINAAVSTKQSSALCKQETLSLETQLPTNSGKEEQDSLRHLQRITSTILY